MSEGQSRTDADRLARIELELAALRAECVLLRARNEALQGPPRPDAQGLNANPSDAAVSRRGLLAGVGAAAVAVGLVASSSPASAASSPVVLGADNSSTTTTSIDLTGSSNASGLAVFTSSAAQTGVFVESSNGGTAVYGNSLEGTGISGYTQNGHAGAFAIDATNSTTECVVINHGGTGTGLLSVAHRATAVEFTAAVVGDSDTVPGVAGLSSGADAVYGETLSNQKAGVRGVDSSSNGGFGVEGTSTLGTGVYGSTGSSGFNAVAGIIGESNANYGACGFSASKSGVRAASGSAEGVRATSTSGVGGSFSGGRAAITLLPTSTTGRPTTGAHAAGDIVVDKNGSLYLCTKSGTPGSWVKVTVSAA